jgi:hypothetical protein
MMSWDDLPDVSKRVVLDQLDELREREGRPSTTEAARARSANVRAIIDAALAKLASGAA